MRLFVYGTLKRGFSRNSVLKNCEGNVDFLMFPGKMLSLGAFPALVKYDAVLSKIWGETYEIDTQILLLVDRIEGYPDLYTREQRTTREGHLAWVYFFNQEPPASATVIETGAWVKGISYAID
jgi:gamma-glutamylcyclotransferase (GGCT)/AIG2-like uncharacterized protein YtfP